MAGASGEDSTDDRGGQEFATLAHDFNRMATELDGFYHQLEQKVPGYKPWSMAIPESDYGQAGTNNNKIPPFVLGWLDRHFPVVFGGDYLDRRRHQKGHDNQGREKEKPGTRHGDAPVGGDERRGLSPPNRAIAVIPSAVRSCGLASVRVDASFLSSL